MELHILRHTKPDVPPDTCYGQTDYPVADSFAAEVEAIRPILADDYDAVIASPLQRCQSLAKAVAPLPFSNDARFKEFSFGDWEGRRWDSFTEAEFSAWQQNYVHHAAPGGESLLSFYERVNAGFDDLLTRYSQQKVLLVAHAGVIRCAWVRALALDLAQFLRIELSYGECCGFRLSDDPERERILFKYPSQLPIASATAADPPPS